MSLTSVDLLIHSLRRTFVILLAVLFALACPVRGDEPERPVEISGRYPHLAMFNHQGECGTGAVVPWADRLWVITYAPHQPRGSDDKLYEIDAALNRITRPESVGGTPADRMIHRESNQLIIGPYLIDAQRNVRVVTPSQMPGRLTAVARHLTDPANKVYVYDMEGTLYELDVHTLAVTKLFDRVAPGAHGKGAYSGQERLVVGNNGDEVVNKAKPAAEDPGYTSDREADGCLAEWDGRSWSVVQRRQFMDITGPGGIAGAPDPNAPLWALGWDKRSVILALRDGGKWANYRLPIADYSYVARHGWYTEWPRIREVAPGKLLMNIHGGWFEFPRTFAAGQSGGIRPIGNYLKITGDFCGWNGRIIFGCDDASIMANPLLGQSQSNLWFTTWAGLSRCGLPCGAGGPWVDDAVKAGEPSEPYLLNGYAQRVIHLSHDSNQAVTFTFEIDADGHGKWAAYQSVTVPPRGYAWHIFPKDFGGQWIRVRTDIGCAKASVYFNYGPGGGAAEQRDLFASLPDASEKAAPAALILRPLGHDTGTLLMAAQSSASRTRNVAIELLPDLTFRPFSGNIPAEPKDPGAAADYRVSADQASIIITQANHRYRLPVSNAASDTWPDGSAVRQLREVVTERFLLNAGGSFFMVPRPTAGGAQRLEPICTHDKRISDFCSWRGMTVLAGARPDAKSDGHTFIPADHSAGLWLGDIDDLWQMGKPRGRGGPLLQTTLKPGEPSDPYLMTGYDKKILELSHDSTTPVSFVVEVDYRADGKWRAYKTFEVPPGKTITHEFPRGYSAHWVRLRCSSPCKATARLIYE